MKYWLLFLASLIPASFCNAERVLVTPSFGVWSEWVQYSKLPDRFSSLKKQNSRLHVAVREDEISKPEVWNDFITMMTKARSQEIEVWIWPLLSKEHGYWLNQWNAERYSKFVQNLVQNLSAERISPVGISMDLEPSPEKLEHFLDLISRMKLSMLIKEARNSIDASGFESTRAKIQKLARILHSAGIKTHAVTTPFVLEDSSQKKTVQQIFGVPIDPDNFDYITFMAYRSEFERMAGKMNSGMIYEYSKRALKEFGPRAGIDLGVVGNITFPHEVHGYQEPAQLHEDIAAALAAGITRMQVYSLDGMDERNWLQGVRPHRPFVSIKFDILDRLFRVLMKRIESSSFRENGVRDTRHNRCLPFTVV